MSARRNLISNLDVLDTIIDDDFVFKVSRGSRQNVAVVISEDPVVDGPGSFGWTLKGEGHSFEVALDRAISAFRKKYLNHMAKESGLSVRRLIQESDDPIVVALSME